MDSAMLGQDAVIDTIGGKLSFKATTLEENAAATIIASMQSSKARRLVVTSMIGVMEGLVESSDLDWIIVRLPFINDDPGTGQVPIFPHEDREVAHKLTRADLATFMVDQLSSDRYLHQAVAVANS